MTTILVTGGTGFLGSNLINILLQNKTNKVICVDNNYTGSTRNIEKHLGNENFIFIKHDIINPFQTPVEFGKIDEIYHLACPASPKAYQGKHAIFTTKTCVHGSLNILEIAKEHGAKVLFTSTSEIYGEPEMHPQTEEYRGNVNPIGIRACYDEGKRCAESIFFDYHREYNIDIKVVRIFNTYGPNMDPNDGRVVSNFICQALKSEDITIYGDGSQTRSFCYVDDLIDIIYTSMQADRDFTGPMNIGNPGEFTVKQLADLVIEKINPNLKVTYKPLPKDDPTQRRPDISLAKSKFNWSPDVKLNEGLDKTIEYFKSVIG